jgi:c-di-GMP-binding flagellar brake protein YcgR
MDEGKQPVLARKMGVLAIEKRKYPRFSVELPLDYARVEADATHGGIVANASEGGILVYLPERIETGALLRVDIFYVNGLELTTVSAVAKVVWSDLAARETWGEYRYGLEFKEIDPHSFSRLMNLLKDMSK